MGRKHNQRRHKSACSDDDRFFSYGHQDLFDKIVAFEKLSPETDTFNRIQGETSAGNGMNS